MVARRCTKTFDKTLRPHLRNVGTEHRPLFLVQEINRELNTIGAKIEGGRATETVIAAKAELERVREQVQNVE